MELLPADVTGWRSCWKPTPLCPWTSNPSTPRPAPGQGGAGTTSLSDIHDWQLGIIDTARIYDWLDL